MAAGMLGIHSSWGCLKQHGHPDIQGNDVTSLICHEMAYLQSIVPMIGTTYCYKRIRTLIYTFLPVECIVTFILTFFIVFLMTLCLDYRQHRVAKNEPPNGIIYSIPRTCAGLSGLCAVLPPGRVCLHILCVSFWLFDHCFSLFSDM